jgi:4-amino-4-deoxy-L-arabinose transferase-like glycosyltransferase
MAEIAETSAEKRRRRGRRNIRLSTYLKFLGFFAIFVFGIHLGYVQMPYYWDEVGQFVPAAWDIHDSGRIVPVSTTPNIHPPAVMAWVALFWKVFTESVLVARCAMLLFGALLLAAAFLLAVELCGSAPGLPAFFATFALALSPLVFTQSLMVQLDLPAAAFTCLALYFFLSERHWPAVAASCLLVLTKETGVLLPLVLFVWLAFEKRYRRAAYYLIPAAVLGLWLVFLHHRTGSWFGNTEFGRYNLLWTMRLSHIAFSLARRFYFLFIGNFHWIGTLGILAGISAGLFRRRRWAVAGTFALLHVVMVSVLGGAVLERYMVPVLPLFYAAALVGFSVWTVNRRWLAYMAMVAGLVAGLFVNPLFWPFPYENNLAVATFTKLHARAAQSLESEYAGARVATVWPLSAVLANPRLGYVKAGFQVVELKSFTSAALNETEPKSYDILVRFSRDWDPDRNLLRDRAFRWAARQTIGYEDPVTGDELETVYKMKLVHLYQEDGQWVEIYRK